MPERVAAYSGIDVLWYVILLPPPSNIWSKISKLWFCSKQWVLETRTWVKMIIAQNILTDIFSSLWMANMGRKYQLDVYTFMTLHGQADHLQSKSLNLFFLSNDNDKVALKSV